MAAKGRRGRWAEVTCAEHGKLEEGCPNKPKQVVVAIPATKRERMAGCPQCKREQVTADA